MFSCCRLLNVGVGHDDTPRTKRGRFHDNEPKSITFGHMCIFVLLYKLQSLILSRK